MKRALFENVNPLPYATGGTINREGYLSGVLGVSIPAITGSPTGVTVTITPTHCDTASGTYVPLDDDTTPLFWAGNPTAKALESGQTAAHINIPLDFLGCKQYVKLTLAVAYTGGSSPSGAASYALVLGDPSIAPV